MQAGLLLAWDRYEMEVALSGTLVKDTYGVQIGGGLTSQYTPTATAVSTGITLGVQAINGDGGILITGSYYNLQVPALSINESISAALTTTMTSHIEIDNLRFYQQGGVWLVTWAALRWYTEGTLQLSLGAESFTSLILTPASIPLFGIPPTLSAGASSDVEPSIPYGQIASNESAACTVTGGWRVKLPGASSYTAFPVSVSAASVPSSPGGCMTSTSAAPPSASDTYSGAASAAYSNSYSSVQIADLICDECSNGPATIPAKYHQYQIDSDWQQSSSSVMLLPCLPMAVNRVNASDYAALIYRGGFPEVHHSGSNTCCHFTDPSATGCPDTTSVVTSIAPSLPAALDTVLNARHAIEDPLYQSVLAPYGYSATRQEVTTYPNTLYDPGACPPITEGETGTPGIVGCAGPGEVSDYALVSVTFPDVQQRAANTDMLAYLDHTDDIARYLNFTADPHWSYFYWFPPDLASGAAVTPTEWRVEGNRANPSDYWLPLRQQWLSNPSLPSGENRQTRNHLVTCPGKEGALGGFVSSVGFGTPTSWWGVNRFQVQDVTPPASLPLGSTSAPGWACTNGTAAFGSDIVLTPTGGHTVLTLEYDEGRFTEAPYFYPHLAGSLGLGWVGTNVASVSVYEVNQAGDAQLLTSTAGTVARPTATDSKYAGSWGQNFGLDGVSDTGADLLASGVSSATLAGAETNVAFELLAGWTAAKLRFVITVVDPTQPVTIHYPTYYAASGPGVVVQETGQSAVLLYPNGPGLRWGQWKCDDGSGGLLATPTVRTPGSKSTALDWLVWKRLLLEGISGSSGLTAEMASLYDSVEGQGIADLASASVAAFIDAGNAAGRGLLINTAAEVPPLAILPRLVRGSNLQETGPSFGLNAYSFAQERICLISAQNAAHLYAPSPRTQWTTASATTLSGWVITEHRHAVTNNEGATFLIGRVGQPDAATASPWHGYTLVWAVTTTQPLALCLVEDWRGYWEGSTQPDGSLAVARVWSIEQAFNSLDMFAIDTSSDCDEPQMMIQTEIGMLSVVYKRGNGTSTPYAIYRAISHDNGATWLATPASGPYKSGSGGTGIEHAREVFNERTSERLFFYNDGSGSGGTGLILVDIYDPNDVLVGTFPSGGIGALMADDTSFGACFVKFPSNAIACSFFSDGTKYRFRSDDEGRTWWQTS